MLVRKPKPGAKIDLATIRLGIEEKALFQRVATERGISLAEFIREGANRYARQVAA